MSWKQFARPAEVVAWLGAVQAQDYLGAKWGLGLRTREPSDEAVEREFNEGRILRTHVMRPTWHFVSPKDIRWMLELTAPRVNAGSAYMHRQVGLDTASLSRTSKVIEKALEGGRHLTRSELARELARAGLPARGVRLTYVMMRAELDAIVCSGPRRGKQFTYALLDERAPSASSLPREDALAELAKSYFTGHGPATLRDFVWWSGLKAADARAGLEAARSGLDEEVADGETYWSSDGRRSPDPPARAFLLPTFDEILVGYASFGASRRGGEARNRLVFNSPLLLGGRVAGTWRRTQKREAVTVEVAPFRPLEPGEVGQVDAAVRGYGGFLRMRTEWTLTRWGQLRPA